MAAMKCLVEKLRTKSSPMKDIDFSHAFILLILSGYAILILDHWESGRGKMIYGKCFDRKIEL